MFVRQPETIKKIFVIPVSKFFCCFLVLVLLAQVWRLGHSDIASIVMLRGNIV